MPVSIPRLQRSTVLRFQILIGVTIQTTQRCRRCIVDSHRGVKVFCDCIRTQFQVEVTKTKAVRTDAAETFL